MDYLKQTADDLIQSGLFAGIEWQVSKGGKGIFSGKSGFQDLADGSEIPANALYRIYSMTKPIISVLALKLIEDGQLQLTTTLAEIDNRFLNMSVLNSDGHLAPADGLITVDHLLTHRAGFSYDFSIGCAVAPYYRQAELMENGYRDLGDIIEILSDLPLVFNPGSNWRYSVATDVLAHVLETRTRKTISELLKKHIFDPLEMNETKFYLTKQERDRFQPLFINTGALKGFTYELNELSYKKNNEAYFGGEGLVSTLGDYSNFCKMLLNGGSYNGKKIISQNSINLMTKKYSQSYPNEEFADTRKLGFYYGFSLFVLENPEIDNTNSTKGIYGWSGYHNTHFWIDPEKQLFAIFLSRSRQGVSNIDTQKEFRRAVYKTIIN